MPMWKKNIFARAIQSRVASEGRAPEDIIAEYTNLTQDEISMILDEIN